MLKKGESKTIQLTLGSNDLSFYDASVNSVVEPGEFEVFVGGNSRDVLQEQFWLK